MRHCVRPRLYIYYICEM